MADESEKSETAKKEEEILAFWQRAHIFEKTLQKPSPKGEFVFYEGPPTANGRPGIHHLESRAFKDAIPRYKTMRGYRVRRRAGWDTHGLPVEIEVEKQLSFSGKKDIEAYGIAAFNKKCRESVLAYIDEWDRFTKRIGYWVNQDDAYYTFNPAYMESLWHIMRTIHDRGLLYKDFKVVPWCPRCETALSSHELAQGYEEVTDLSITAKFELIGEPKTYFLAWTTTPWTLPGNVALAVGERVRYGTYDNGNERIILAKSLAHQLSGEWKLLKEYNGSELVGKEYRPLFPFLKEKTPLPESEKFKNAYKVYPAEFVTTEEGTGIVHTAVLYGQDDFDLGTKVGLPKQHLVDSSGKFMDGVGFLSGRFVRDEAVAVDIVKDLAHRGLLFAKEKHTHTYPFCWRCKTPLIYYARDSWFIRMTELSRELVKENKSVHWEPTHIRDGRMGEWLEGVRDWAVSRERYWATPLPVWESADGSGKERIVIGSVADLKKYVKKSGNTYFLMRHGEAETNVRGIMSADENKHHLTEKGRGDVAKAAESLRNKHIDLIITSPLLRTGETAEIIREKIGLAAEQVVVDARIREIGVGTFEGRSVTEYDVLYKEDAASLDRAPDGGETKTDVKKRVGEFLYELEATYQGKTILIISHGSPTWAMQAVAAGLSRRDSAAFDAIPYFMQGEARAFDFTPLPHNEEYELDLHRPYIDELELVSEKGAPLKRANGVLDVWFDSGGMPFAQDHYPFENKKRIDGKGYPADFISEAVDQTRGWFYTLLAVGVLMGRGAPYKNVIVLGHLLDEKGQKMSKSKGNVINPWEAIERWGVDTLRFWMYSVNAAGDSKNFEERTVREASRALSWFEHSAKFYEISRDERHVSGAEQTIDAWIKKRTEDTVKEITRAMDRYAVHIAARSLALFFEDLSQWYVRRVRDRVRGGDTAALETLRHTLHTASRMLAPFAPFLAEQVFRTVRSDTDPESVHLAPWPRHEGGPFGSILHTTGDTQLLALMAEARSLASKALKLRQEANVKVRQPLARLTVKREALKGKSEFIELVRDEVNVKEIVFDTSIQEDVALDTAITPDLKEEGDVRELVRSIQDLRKDAGFSPKDKATLVYAGDATLLKKHWEEVSRAASLERFEQGEETHVKKL